VHLGVHALRIDIDEVGWRLRTSRGEIVAEDVIVATGYAKDPFIPAWAGRKRFRRTLLHAADYRDPEPFRGRDVLVVGAGSSGMEIAHDLAEGGARRVRISVRTPPNIILRSVGGLPSDLPAIPMLHLPERVADAQLRAMRKLLLGDLSAVGLPIPDEGVVARLRRLGVGPAVVDREVIRAIEEGRIEIVSGVEELDPDGTSLADGTRISPDAVIAATGYRCGLEPLVGHLGLLDERGVPRTVGGQEVAPGLRFVGYVPVPGQIRQAAREARNAVSGIRRARLRDTATA
jgi:putative flavoprotein involved in K+ transport